MKNRAVMISCEDEVAVVVARGIAAVEVEAIDRGADGFRTDSTEGDEGSGYCCDKMHFGGTSMLKRHRNSRSGQYI